MSLVTIPSDPEYRRRVNFFYFGLTLATFKRIGRGRRYCSTVYDDFIGSIFQPCETANYIRTLREQNSILILGLSHRKIFPLRILLVH
jgi:hypothetical protein